MKWIIKLAIAYMRRNGYSKDEMREILHREGWMLATLARFEAEDQQLTEDRDEGA